MANGNKNKRANNKKKKRNSASTPTPVNSNNGATSNSPQNEEEYDATRGGMRGFPRPQPRQSQQRRSEGRTRNNSGGLDSDRDTEDQVDTMLRFFPAQLRNDGSRSGGGIQSPPGVTTPTIYHQLYKSDGQTLNLKAIPFIPVMAGLGVELSESGFQPGERGGLLSKLPQNPWNMLQLLVICFDKSQTNKRNKEFHELADTTLCGVLQKLVEKDLLKKGDILQQNLVMALCANSYAMPCFPYKRFQFLVQMDPTALMTPCLDHVVGSHPYFLPIHYCSHRNNIEAFQICFLEGMKHYPNKLGFVFHKSHNNDFADTSRRIQARRVGIDKTPFEMECDQYGEKKVSEIIYDRLTKSVDKDDTITTDIESLFLALAIGDSEAASKIDFNAVDLFLGNYPDAKRQLKEFSSNPEKFAAINARASSLNSAATTTTTNCLATVSPTTTVTTTTNGLENLKISGIKVAVAAEEDNDDSYSSGNNNNNDGEGKHDDGNTTAVVTNNNDRKLAAATTVEPSAAATAEKEIATAKKVTNYIHDYLFSDHITMAYNNCGIDSINGEEEKE
mmetsp:Transcript_43390/g.47072  ORF Transcript_43390/g.47072 Transcript_43390/m.47072 type:complete len:560 (+) Transcript_43390:100-1779(+)